MQSVRCFDKSILTGISTINIHVFMHGKTACFWMVDKSQFYLKKCCCGLISVYPLTLNAECSWKDCNICPVLVSYFVYSREHRGFYYCISILRIDSINATKHTVTVVLNELWNIRIVWFWVCLVKIVKKKIWKAISLNGI